MAGIPGAIRAVPILAFVSLGACGQGGGPSSGDGSPETGLPTTVTGAEETGGGETGAEAGEDGGPGPKLDALAEDGESGESGADGGGDDCEMEIVAIVRDFRSTHADFEAFWGTSAFTGLVLPTLGADGTPVYNPSPVAPPGYEGAPVQITSAASFADWYHDVPDTNVPLEVTLPLTETGPDSGVFSYDSDAFFPLDGAGFNDETFPDTSNTPHNFHFTTEVHVEFVYEPGQVFSFSGDDDLWLFIDGALVIDLGGLHPELNASVELDSLGLVAGETYPLDLFHAERRHDQSNFRVDTSIQCFMPAPID